MKKISIIIAAVSLMALTACQKGLNADNAAKFITKTFTVSDKEWTDDAEVKSLYEPGIGVHLTQNEPMMVFYATSSDSPIYTAIGGTPDGTGKYTISHEATEDSYDYLFLLPYIVKNGTSNNGAGQKCRISPIQFPTTTSFDANMDYLIGKPQKNLAPQTELSDVRFKRITAPFKLVITDSQNLLGDSKINVASLSLSQDPGKYQSLVGTAYLNISENVDEVKINNFQANGAGNALTALYPQGLSRADDCYTVWYSVAPITIAAGTSLTVSVNTETKTFTRTVTIPSEKTFSTTSINTLRFDISGAGCVEENSLTWHFTPLTKAKEITSLKASDGQTGGWSKSDTGIGISKDNKGAFSVIPNSLNFTYKKETSTYGELELAPIENKTISKMRIYMNMLCTDGKGILKLTSGDQTVEGIRMDFTKLSTLGGYQEVTVANGSSPVKLTLTSTDGVYVSAISVIHE